MLESVLLIFAYAGTVGYSRKRELREILGAI
jgi:hypothetical protein